MDFLRDPFWNGVSAILALLAIVVEMVIQRAKIQSYGLYLLNSIICAVGGIAVMSLGPMLNEIVQMSLMEGIPAMWEQVSFSLGSRGSNILAAGISFGLLPGTVTAMAALSGQDREQRVRRAIVAGVTSLIVIDTIQFIQYDSAAFGLYLFYVVSNVIGGTLGGYLIALITEAITNVFGTSAA